jgi:hypothetical protein
MENLPSLHLKNNFASSNELKIVNSIKNDLRIRQFETDEELKQVLRYVFTLIGLRPEQIPSDMEKAVLIQFIIDNYGNYTPIEIRIAFELAIKKDLNVKTDHFGLFSPMYFASIMNAYQEFRSKITTELMRIEQKIEIDKDQEYSEAEILEIQKDFDETVTIKILNKYEETGKLIFDNINPLRIYNSVIKFHKILEFTDQEKQEIRKQAVINHDLLIMDLEVQKSKSFQEHKLKELMLESFQSETKVNDSIKEECYKICIKQAFDKMIKEKINL